ncbi:MAG TPA: BamA/TamA family outer membrane protein [Rhizomicrobium sp.]|nr:BamA/TamA family outer membrane protein [Rhizomicrobium sp.]
MFFKSDRDSKSSFIGTGAFFTSNGSWGAAALGDIAFDDDRYRSRAVAGYAHINYDFYGTRATNAGNTRHVFLNQSGALFQAALEARVAPDLYVGGRLRYLTVKSKFDIPELAGELVGNDGPLANLQNNVTTLGPTATYDTRDKDYSPGNGYLIQAGLEGGLNDFISRQSYLRGTLLINRYDTLVDDLVLASHGSFCGEGGKVPIFDLCLFGSQNDLRGYAVGRYQDKTMFTLQEELRWHVFWRIGLVAFAGLGSVAPTINRFDELLYSGGAGMRFLASREYGVNIGIDGAVNAQGEATYYIQVGEAF